MAGYTGVYMPLTNGTAFLYLIVSDELLEDEPNYLSNFEDFGAVLIKRADPNFPKHIATAEPIRCVNCDD